MQLSVEPDSSHPWNAAWEPWRFPHFDTLQEEFLVTVPVDGLLTIAARPEGGNAIGTLTCPSVRCPERGTVAIPVEAGQSPLHFSIEIPRASAPQRYEIQTSLR
jgi:hypothetical protein